MTNSRQAILNRINEALKTPSILKSLNPDVDESIQNGIDLITPKDKNGLWLQFKKELEAIAGECAFVKNINEAGEIITKFVSENKLDRIAISQEDVCNAVAEKIQKNIPNVKIVSSRGKSHEERKQEFAKTEVAVVNPTFAIADIGSLVFQYDKTGTSLPHFLCDNTFAIIYKNQIVANQFELLKNIDSEKSLNMVFVTGPSRTADIEKVLVLGAHGPRKLIAIVVEESRTNQ